MHVHPTPSHSTSGPSFLRRSARLFLVLVPLAVAAATMAAVSQRPLPVDPIAAQGPLPVATFVPEAVDGYQVTRWYLGRVEAARSSELGFELAGQLDAIAVQEGDRVSSGQLLATLNTGRLEAQRAELEAAVAEADARRRLAQLTLTRLSGVVNAGGVTRQQLDEAREGLRVAEAASNLARSRVDTIKVELAKSHLRAPFEGTIVRRMVDEGRVVGAGEPVLELLEGGAPEVRVGVPADLVEHLSLGSSQTVRIAGRELAARVLAVIPAVDPRTRTVDVRLALPPDAAGVPRAGEIASVGLQQWLPRRGYWVPLEALTEGLRGTWNVYTLAPVEGAGEAWEIRAYPVETLHVAPDRAYVAGDLSAARRLVASGLHRVVPGQHVRPAAGWIEAGLGAPHEAE